MRASDWVTRLIETIEAARLKRFSYGDFDCGMFAADCVLAVTGVDKVAELRGYKSKEEALAIIERYGSVEAMLTALLHTDPTHPAFAQRGDIVLAELEGEDLNGLVMGVCDGIKCWFPAFHGITERRTSSVLKVWKVS